MPLATMHTLSEEEFQRKQWRVKASGDANRLQESRERELMKDLAAPLNHLPQVEFAFAYGSGVFAQAHAGPTNEVPMVDYILGVTSPADWHSQNLEQNPHHYASWLSMFGGNVVTRVAEYVGAGVHFNAFVPWQDKKIKYGVISVDNLAKDILTWQRLYISGRLQKPVRFLVDRICGEELNRVNLQAALAAALLLLPSEFSEEDLYGTICRVSYMGDMRMLFAEDKQKVRKIVHGSASKFQELYRSSIHNYAVTDILQPPPVFASDLQARFEQDGSKFSRCFLLSSLPACLLERLAQQTGTQYQSNLAGSMAIAEAVVHSTEGHAKMLTQAVSSIVRASSLRQMLSGFLAAGGINAGRYVARKVSKAWRSRW